MLSDEEKKFLEYWEQNREREKKTFRQLLIGLPLGLLFAIPILLNFVSGWYKRADMVGRSQFSPAVLLIAVLAIVIFYALFSRKARWDQQELRYRELKAREQRSSREQTS